MTKSEPFLNRTDGALRCAKLNARAGKKEGGWGGIFTRSRGAVISEKVSFGAEGGSRTRIPFRCNILSVVRLPFRHLGILLFWRRRRELHPRIRVLFPVCLQ